MNNLNKISSLFLVKGLHFMKINCIMIRNRFHTMDLFHVFSIEENYKMLDIKTHSFTKYGGGEMKNIQTLLNDQR